MNSGIVDTSSWEEFPGRSVTDQLRCSGSGEEPAEGVRWAPPGLSQACVTVRRPRGRSSSESWSKGLGFECCPRDPALDERMKTRQEEF